MIGIFCKLTSTKTSGSSQQGGLSPEDERYILARAYVPEHIVSLTALISKGEPFLIEDYLRFLKDNYCLTQPASRNGDGHLRGRISLTACSVENRVRIGVKPLLVC
jgi:hypothetical protein